MDVLSDIKPVVGLPADAHGITAGAYGSAINLAGVDEVIAILNAGTAGSSGTVDVSFEYSATSGGSKTVITGGAFAQVTTSNDETIYVGRIRIDQVGANFLHTKKVVGTAACDFGVTLLLVSKRGIKPLSQVNSTAFDTGIAA